MADEPDEQTAMAPDLGSGDGTRPPLPPMPAPQRPMTRRITVVTRAPFLPDHDHIRHGLKGSSE